MCGMIRTYVPPKPMRLRCVRAVARCTRAGGTHAAASGSVAAHSGLSRGISPAQAAVVRRTGGAVAYAL